ncbi:haloacid dehalogenase-like hydrolase [Roseinatronobacter sp.]|uniref:haloacid dehalogenase-like hydrolase n=1 Tax=Roseinatronobacter sp. TaxID=1945755 RepID=UPI0025F3731F|nr:haloacid dehalogenase-like hydrolase [Rhodobaca sp.]
MHERSPERQSLSVRHRSDTDNSSHAPDPAQPVLVADLDGTLIHSDMLYETFWAALANDWRTPFIAFGALLGGRAALKQRLATLGPVDVKALPYNDEVVQYITQRRAQGVKTALVTASDQKLAEKIAEFQGIFDIVHGSGEGINLKGSRKAEFLSEAFPQGFSYMGDSVADLKVWPKASKAITVTTSQKLRTQVEKLGCEVEHLSARQSSVADWVMALGPREWGLNLLVFVPLLFALPLSSQAIWGLMISYLALSLVTSGEALARPLLQRQSPAVERPPMHTIPIFEATFVCFLLTALGVAVAAFFSAPLVVVLIVLIGAVGVLTANKSVQISFSFGILRNLLRFAVGLLSVGSLQLM